MEVLSQQAMMAMPGSTKTGPAAAAPKGNGSGLKVRFKFPKPGVQQGVSKTTTHAGTDVRQAQIRKLEASASAKQKTMDKKRKRESSAPAAQKPLPQMGLAQKQLSVPVKKLTEPREAGMLMASDDPVEALGKAFATPHKSLHATWKVLPALGRIAIHPGISEVPMQPAKAQDTPDVAKMWKEQPIPEEAAPLAKKQRLQELAATQQTARPAAAVSQQPDPVTKGKCLQPVSVQEKPVAAPAMQTAAAPAQQAQQQRSPQQLGSIAPAAQQGAAENTPAFHAMHAGKQAEHAQAAQQEAAHASSAPESQNGSQQNAPAALASKQNAVAAASKDQAAFDPQYVENVKRAKAKRAEREAERKRREAEEAKLTPEERAARDKALQDVANMEARLSKDSVEGGVPECIRKGTLFWDEAERQYWKDVYRLAGKQWPDMYNRPIAHQDIEEGDKAPAQNRQPLPSSNASTSMPHAKTRSGLTRSNSDMDLDQSESQRPEAPKLNLQQPLFKSEAALVEAAASAQSCGTHQGASPDVMNSFKPSPGPLYPTAAGTAKIGSDVKEQRTSPGSSESDTERMNIRSRPSLEEGELAGKRKDTRSDKDYDQHQRYSRERSGDRERRSSRYSHERSPGRARRYSRYSHERSPDRESSEWRERSRSPICRRDDKRGSRARILKAEDQAKKAADDVQHIKGKINDLQSSTDHDEIWYEDALAAWQKRMRKAEDMLERAEDLLKRERCQAVISKSASQSKKSPQQVPVQPSAGISATVPDPPKAATPAITPAADPTSAAASRSASPDPPLPEEPPPSDQIAPPLPPPDMHLGQNSTAPAPVPTYGHMPWQPPAAGYGYAGYPQAYPQPYHYGQPQWPQAGVQQNWGMAAATAGQYPMYPPGMQQGMYWA